MFVTKETLKTNLPGKVVDDLWNNNGEAMDRMLVQVNELIARTSGVSTDDADGDTLAALQLYGAQLFEYFTGPFRGSLAADVRRELRLTYQDALQKLAQISVPVDEAVPETAITTKNTTRLGSML